MHRRYPLLVTALTILVVACAPNSASTPRPVPGEEGEGVLGAWVHSGGYRRTYSLTRPTSPDSLDSYPLLVVLHGAGGTGDGLRRWSGLDTLAAAAGYAVVFPDGIHRSWNLGCVGCTPAEMQEVDDLRFVQTLVRHLADSLPVDTTRVFVVGHSQGAQFVHYYACAADLQPAGIADVAGLWVRRTAVACPSRRGVAVLMIHGDRDPILPWGGPRNTVGALSMPEAVARWTELLECPWPARYTESPDTAGDGTSVQATDFGPCRDGSAVRMLRIRGGGHGWPGNPQSFEQSGPTTANLDGATEILRFFEPYARSSTAPVNRR